jgi:tellurite resistance protein TerC
MLTGNLFFIFFMLFVVIMLVLDLGVFHKKDHAVGVKEAALWTGFWVLLAMAFALLLYLKPEWVHGHPVENPRELAEQFLAGYFLEESLSIDNIFVMIMIFTSFGIKKEYYHRILFWGIFGAIVLRFIFIFGLSAAVAKFSWVLAVFGVWLIYSGVKMFREEEEENIDTANHPIVKFSAKHFPVTTQTYGHNFFHREADGSKRGKLYITPLFVVLLVIEFSDIIFAVDSIPAVFSVTKDPVIVYTSNIFAIMGLRSLFFLMSDMANRFWMLHYGLGALLTFIGLKMICGEFFDLHISTLASLLTILGILTLSITLSLLIRKPEK